MGATDSVEMARDSKDVSTISIGWPESGRLDRKILSLILYKPQSRK